MAPAACPSRSPSATQSVAPAAAIAVPAVAPAPHTIAGVPAVSQRRSLPSSQFQPQVMNGDVARQRQVTGTCVQ